MTGQSSGQTGSKLGENPKLTGAPTTKPATDLPSFVIVFVFYSLDVQGCFRASIF